MNSLAETMLDFWFVYGFSEYKHVLHMNSLAETMLDFCFMHAFAAFLYIFT
jgi:hypothetical protein